MKHRDQEEDPSHPRRRPCPPRQRSLALPHRPSCLLKCRLQRPGSTSLLPLHQRLTPDLSSTSAALLLFANWLSRSQHQLLSPRPSTLGNHRNCPQSMRLQKAIMNVTREMKMKRRCHKFAWTKPKMPESTLRLLAAVMLLASASAFSPSTSMIGRALRGSPVSSTVCP